MLLMLEGHLLHPINTRWRKWGNFCSVLIVTTCFLIVMTVLALFAVDMTQRVHVVYISGNKPVFITDKRFLSIALDSSIIARGFKHFDTKNEKLQNLMRALSPCYLRVGGTMSDRLTFLENESSHSNYMDGNIIMDGGECSYDQRFCDYLEKPNFTMNADDWLQLNYLARKTGVVMIFGLNSLKRFDNGSWNQENAESLIEFSQEHNLQINWELGNEPNAFRHQFDYDVDPTQMAEDFQKLRRILKKYPKYANSRLVGPDVTRPRSQNTASEIYLRNFLRVGKDSINAITWHQYYFDGSTAKIGDFLDPQNFDILQWQITEVKNIVNSENISKPIWLGETSSAYGGGAPRLSDRYIASFLWLDKLGMAAKNGLSVVIRQSIFQGHYALINEQYNPTPDWWVSVLYKKLVGRKVVDCQFSKSEKLRFYCQCTNRRTYFGFDNTKFVTVFALNLDRRKAKIRFEGIKSTDEDQDLKVDAYILTTVDRIDSKFIYLNNRRLHLTATNDVPELMPNTVNAYPYVEIPAYSLAFWVVPVSNNELQYC